MKSNKTRIGMWSILAGGLLVAAAAFGSAGSPIKDAQRYDCASTCYGYYRTCLMSGKAPSICQSQYATCINGCGGGGTLGGAQAD